MTIIDKITDEIGHGNKLTGLRTGDVRSISIKYFKRIPGCGKWLI